MKIVIGILAAAALIAGPALAQTPSAAAPPKTPPASQHQPGVAAPPSAQAAPRDAAPPPSLDKPDPAKDAAMTAPQFQAFYPQWEQFARYRDPLLTSSFWERVTGDKPSI